MKGLAGSTALLNPVFWLVFDELSTWRSMSQLYCNVEDMADLASSVYPTSSAALVGTCPALSTVPKVSRNLVTYLAGLIVVTPYIGGTADTCAGGLGEAHADIVLQVLKLATDEAYIDFLKRKLVELDAAAPKSDLHAAAQEENDGEVGKRWTGVRAECQRWLQ